jgi:TRAP-type mannitol/chloroaromatic compound transport system substrate-binding protein
MTIMDFTVEEINLIALYRTDSKAKTILRLNDSFPHMDEDMKEIATSSARKLSVMTDAEFAVTEFVPADDGGEG